VCQVNDEGNDIGVGLVFQKRLDSREAGLGHALVPQHSLEDTVKDRVSLLAKKRLKSASHTMALEAQSVDEADEGEQFKRLIQQLVDKSGSALWEDDA
jgi:hypothetical protein